MINHPPNGWDLNHPHMLGPSLYAIGSAMVYYMMYLEIVYNVSS